MIPSLQYLDFELRIEREDDGYCARVLSSPAGEAWHRFELPLTRDRIELIILRLGQMRRRTKVRQAGAGGESPEMSAAREIGDSIYRAVFANDVRACFRTSIERAYSQPNTGLRIKLRLDEVPELADLPWELLLDSSGDRFLAQSMHTPIVRYLELPHGVEPLQVEPPLEVLVMIAGPIDQDQLDVEREKTLLQQAFTPLLERDAVRVRYLESATLAELRDELRKHPVHVLHFMGHGGFDEASGEGLLVLEDDLRRSQPVDAHRVATLLHDCRSLQLVVLNACEGARISRTDPYAGVATTLVRQGVPAVIAMQFEISDAAALTFTDELYSALAAGMPIDAALSEARKGIYAMPNDIEWGTPVLYMRSADGVLFDIPPQSRRLRPEDLQQELAAQEQDAPAQTAQVQPQSGAAALGSTGKLGSATTANDSPQAPFSPMVGRPPGSVVGRGKGAPRPKLRLAVAAVVLCVITGAWIFFSEMAKRADKGTANAVDRVASSGVVRPELGLALLEEYRSPTAEQLRSYHSTTRWNAVLNDFTKAASQERAPVRYKAARYFAQGYVFLTKGDSTSAVEAFHKSIDLDQSWALPHHGLAEALSSINKTDEALKAAAEAQRLAPKWHRPVVAAARAHARRNKEGDLDEAVLLYIRAKDMSSGAPDVLAGLAMVYHAKGLNEQASEFAQKALKGDPNEPLVRVMLAEVALEHGNGERAYAEAKKAIGAMPLEPAAWLALGDALVLLKRDDEAAEAYDKLLELLKKKSAAGLSNKRVQAVRDARARKQLPPPRTTQPIPNGSAAPGSPAGQTTGGSPRMRSTKGPRTRMGVPEPFVPKPTAPGPILPGFSNKP